MIGNGAVMIGNVYPVQLANGYELLEPYEHPSRAEMVLRLYDPQWETVVVKHVPYVDISRACMQGGSSALDFSVHDLCMDMDGVAWAMRAFRRMPRAWRAELLGCVKDYARYA